jgi:hypothetical protein
MQRVCPTLWRHLWLLGLHHIFSELYHKRYNFRKSVFEHKMCFNFFYNFCLKHFPFYELFNELSSKMSKRLHVKYPLFLSDLNKTWIFSTDFWKKLKCQVSLKSVYWEPSCSTRRDGRTDRQPDMKLIVAFRNFTKTSKNEQIHCIYMSHILLLFFCCQTSLTKLLRLLQDCFDLSWWIKYNHSVILPYLMGVLWASHFQFDSTIHNR